MTTRDLLYTVKMNKQFYLITCLTILFVVLLTGCDQNLGQFTSQTMVGLPGNSGKVVYDQANGSYTLTAGGENIWGKQDEFYYIWKKISGDLKISADIKWLGKGKDAHRKAGLMIRQGLDADDPYADVVVHGDGLISLQFRKEKGGSTNEIKAPGHLLPSILFERNGDLFSLSLDHTKGRSSPVGSITIPLRDPVYVGLVLSAHDTIALETAVFSNVQLDTLGVLSTDDRKIESSLETLNIETGERMVVHRVFEHLEAPNWSRDGKTLVYNSGGKLYSIPVDGGVPELINTGAATNCNNDHGFSPDGKRIAISHSSENQSLIYIIPAEGGEPEQVTKRGPSYWHGWSPDGNMLAYCAERNGEYDVYTIPVEGGPEKRLTNAPGLDDGPDYSPDGRYIYFNSERAGQMQIWRMKTNGKRQTQITKDQNFNDWFPHPSPDGNWIVFLSYGKDVKGHPPNEDVQLRLFSTKNGEIKTIAHLFGGQGTINVPSWSPNSRYIAFVSYRLVGS